MLNRGRQKSAGAPPPGGPAPCCHPDCYVQSGAKPDTGERVKITCTNPACTFLGAGMHAACFDKCEQALVGSMRHSVHLWLTLAVAAGPGHVSRAAGRGGADGIGRRGCEGALIQQSVGKRHEEGGDLNRLCSMGRTSRQTTQGRRRGGGANAQGGTREGACPCGLCGDQQKRG